MPHAAPGSAFARYPSPLRHRLRFVFSDGEGLRVVAWMMVGYDGSVYFGPRVHGAVRVKQGSAKSDAGLARINYSDGAWLAGDQRGAKLSYHASGRIKAAGQFYSGPNLRDLTQPRLLAQAVFAHYGSFQTIGELSNRDVLVPGGGSFSGRPCFQLDDSSPLCAQVIAAPASSLTMHRLPGATAQAQLLFPFRNLTNCQDIDVAVVFYSGPRGPWPPASYLVWRSEDEAENDGRSP